MRQACIHGAVDLVRRLLDLGVPVDEGYGNSATDHTPLLVADDVLGRERAR
jgi:hypothetical protein